ncbi:MAG: leucine--tRNA ligase [Pyrinomonadaceae bacterium MAG19_C2-C3]|nr:leucine--tRNA ligase [Pyrinomonadaceae bacterium MAG19_C2-C3]
MDEKYFPEKIEQKWQQYWTDTKCFEVEADESREKFYCLEMLPYPSGFLHMGHVRNYSIGDALAWYKRLNGFNVLHPIGWDSFGQPAEQAAIKRRIQPREWTEQNIAHMRGQFKRLGISFDWSREIAAHTPEYYKWDQWFFLQMLERGLVYRRESPVNWCPKDETILSNEQSSGGVCWRCQTPVVKKNLEQWFVKTTEYAEDLLADMREIEAGWSERVLTMQRNWIGRSVGAYIDFPLQERDEKVRVFTTRIDTVFGATAIVLAAEHPLVATLVEGSLLKDDVMSFVNRVREERGRTTSEVVTEEVEKEGVNTGVFAVNPFSDEQLPVWIANYVLINYGAGAVMAVPAHDERDYEFAQKYTLSIRRVIAPITHAEEASGFEASFDEDVSAEMTTAETGYGMLVHSGEWSGKLSQDAMNEMAAHAETEGFGGAAVTYRLRDWGISRQRFWGAPIPIIYCDEHGAVPVPESDLPVRLPERADFTGTGQSPLTYVKEFVETECPTCGRPARRETDTMDTFVDSSWYYFRYCDPHNADAPFDKEKVAYWMPIDQYIGGIEHAVMHLLYTRFWTKMMRDLGLVKIDEPVKNLLTQGMVTNVTKTNEWKAMSKSLGNGIDPDEMIGIYGADAVRIFTMFAAPPENELRWMETGIEGAVRFLRRVHTAVYRWRGGFEGVLGAMNEVQTNDAQKSEARGLRRVTHRTIERVTHDFERLHFNTSIAALMELMNAIGDLRATPENATHDERFAIREALEAMVIMLAPFAPHAAEEMWEGLGHAGGMLQGEGSGARWRVADAELARQEELEIPVQINGKLRSRVMASPDATEDELRAAALADEKAQGFIAGREVVKVIVVPRRLVNIVVR